ncbi:hypothetical protein ACIBL8_39010 [Streptomyces sp. NPDC050523]|uniref:hypothetical protein n=1 Tax=Streptomyces sp. NPDC050523 TaxID=3365622 RepID=UPI00378FFD92
MSNQQYPQQQPGWGGPQQQPYGQQPYGQPPFPQPQPPKKRGAGKIVGLGCLGIVALFVLIGIIAAVAGGGGSNSDASDSSSKDKAVTATGKAAVDDKPKAKKPAAQKPAETKTQAEEFQACVAKSGTATEKAAVKHVTKVTGTDKRNDVLDNAEVFTDFTGGFMSSNAGDAKLIASAFTSCYESDNGLVSVYGKDGDLISNANY